MVKIIILLAFSIILADARKHHLEIRVRRAGGFPLVTRLH